MGRAEYLKKTYDDYFDRLKRLARQLAHFKKLASKLDGEEKAAFEEQIRLLELEIDDYAKNLSKTGIDVIKYVA